jgi:hypothetical protein
MSEQNKDDNKNRREVTPANPSPSDTAQADRDMKNKRGQMGGENNNEEEGQDTEDK